ncbi:MAG: tetratricopeptide repeat protein [Cyanobacteria bacterium J06656_5]
MPQSSFFLGRTQEQDQFRRVLGQYVPASWGQKNFPTVAKLVGRAPQLPDESYVFLFHGPGGMGKTTLTRRLKELVGKEFQGQYQTALIDWDRQRDLNAALKRAHDTIEPQTVLDVLHKELKQSLKDYSGETYSEARQEIQRIEADVEKALASEPPNTALKDVTAQYGGKAIAWIAKKATEGVIDVDPSGTTVAIKVGATLLNQARQLLVKSSLNQADIEIFKQPLETLLESLGKDIAKATQRQPGIIFLDTYEIVDRQICDYTLRQVIQQGGSRCIWVISGRSNLSKSGKRGEKYFRGYADDFSEAQIYPRELLQFSFREIQEYFENKKLSLTEGDAESIAEFSLGIPFVVDLAAAMCAKGKPVAEIVAPVSNDDGEANDRDQVIRETCERFLKHCLDTPETLADRQLTFALAMLRRSQMDLLGAMVDAPTGLKGRLKALQGRYAFLAEDEQRLDEKMANFMQDYLLQGLQRQDGVLQGLNDQAIGWLEQQIEERQKTLSDTAEWFEDERLRGWMLDLVHHYGWRGEDALWGYLVPSFIEAWQYDRAWARNLLQVGETFGRLLAGANRKLLSRMAGVLETKPDLEEMALLLKMLDQWLIRQSLNDRKVQELKVILQLRRGRYLYQAERNDEALAYSLSIADNLPVGLVKLANAMSSLLDDLGFKLGWQKRDAFASSDAKKTFEKAIQINVKNAYAYYGLGAMQYKFKAFEQAIQSLQKAIDLREGDYALAFNALGITYNDLKRYDEAIERYLKAIELDPSYATAHNNLGNTYKALKRYDEAVVNQRSVGNVM